MGFSLAVRLAVPARSGRGTPRDWLRRRARPTAWADPRSDRITSRHGHAGVNRHGHTSPFTHIRTHRGGDTGHCHALASATSGSGDACAERRARHACRPARFSGSGRSTCQGRWRPPDSRTCATRWGRKCRGIRGSSCSDVESGEVEGWVRSLSALSEEERSAVRRTGHDFDVSPSNRFLSLPGVLYDRQTERAYRIGRRSCRVVGIRQRRAAPLPGRTRRRVRRRRQRPGALALLSIPPGERFMSPAGGYILVHERGSSRTFHLLNLEDEANPRVHTRALPWEPLGEPGSAYRIELLDNLIAFRGARERVCLPRHALRPERGAALRPDHPVSGPPGSPASPRTAACSPPRRSFPLWNSVTAGCR